MYTITSERKGTYILIKFYRRGKSGIYRTIKVPYNGGANEIEGNFEDILYTDTITIKGHYTLTLTVGEEYYIHYGIHQGKYKYIGRVIECHYESLMGIIEGQHMFCKVGEENNLFLYYGKSSPFEMTGIIHEYE